jgi:SpoVK/Ycf46/Vps4 family AAA+-type ATPase
LRAAEHPSTPNAPTTDDLFTAARAQSTHRLGVLARQIRPRFQIEHLILPYDAIAQLKEVCNQVRRRHIVYDRWGFDRKLSLGKGINVLFSGPPGVGKTMAAEVFANELDLDLFKIDLSQIVSKYIGETEKNLNRVFDEARASNAILFFDEADALFGKRSEVRDSHDRYANIEIAYLLQKMDEYEGLSVLATNLKQNLDEAFTRRLSFIIDFPFPDEESRLRIWRSIWPMDLPLGDDVDLGYVARTFRLSGGSIKNVAVAAAFLAAEREEPVRTVHLVRATRREFQKMGKTFPDGGLTRDSAPAEALSS